MAVPDSTVPNNPSPPPGSAGATTQIPPILSAPARKGILRPEILIVVVSLAVVLAALLVTGAIPTGGGGSNLTAESSSSALTAANAFATGFPGGPWFLSGLAGIDATSPYQNGTLPPGTNCTASGFSGLSIPAYSAGYSSGKLGTWLVEYVDTAATSELIVQVTNGHATELGLLTGPHCSIGTRVSFPASMVDSVGAAQAALASPSIAEFVNNHSAANADYILFPGFPTLRVGASWILQFSTCDFLNPSAGPAVGNYASAGVNASTGTLTGAMYTAAENCTTFSPNPGPRNSTPIGSAFAAGNPVLSVCPTGSTFALNGCLAGDYTYTLTIEASTVTFGSVLFEVLNAAAGVYAPGGPGGFSVMSITASVAAQASVAGHASMSMTSPFSSFGSGTSDSTPLTSLYTILVDVGPISPAGSGLTFVVHGTGQYTGATNPLSLP